MDSQFITERIKYFILQKDTIKTKMSLELGKEQNYIDNILSGRYILNTSELIAICDYFEITLPEFLSDTYRNPELLRNISLELDDMNEYDLNLILHIIRRLKNYNN